MEKQREQTPRMHIHTHPYDQTFAASIGRHIEKKNNQTTKLSQFCWDDSKDWEKWMQVLYLNKTFLMTFECVCSVLVWWQPDLEREQVRLCDDCQIHDGEKLKKA